MQEKVINIVQETLRSGTFEGMSAILDDVGMTVVLPWLLRLFCFLRLWRFFRKEKQLLLFFWKEKRLSLSFCNGLNIEWLNLTDINRILDAGTQNRTELDPMVALCSSYSLLLNIIDGVFDAYALTLTLTFIDGLTFIDVKTQLLEIEMVLPQMKMVEIKMALLQMKMLLPQINMFEIKMVLLEIKMVMLQIKMVLLPMAMFLRFSNNVLKFQPSKLIDLGLFHTVPLVYLGTTFISETQIIEKRMNELFLVLGRSRSEPEWSDYTGTNLIAMILVLLIEFKWIFLTGNGQRVFVFKFETLVTATDNFHDKNKVGEGGSGTIYKGTTHDGKQIAVKRLLSTSDQGRKEFLNEMLLAKIQHPNIVNLLGCCEKGSQMFVVYEYLTNGSLDKFLFDPEKRKGLDWQKRYNIGLGTARALQYIHEESQLRIVHRDIKASNILLDEELNPKIADFGTAKVFPKDETHVVSAGVVGTYGYMAPEYAMGEQLSVNVDVYSFGILLLELVTGKKISSEMGLLGRIFSSYKSAGTIDQAIIAKRDKKQALRCIHIGLLCTQDNALLRPPMSKVTLMLSTPSVALPVPTKPPLYDEIHERGCCFFR